MNKAIIGKNPRGSRKVPILQCLSCGGDIFLEETTYANYQGRVVCPDPDCKGYQDVIIQKKALITSSQQPDVYAPIRDILVWDIPLEILGDLAEAALDLGVLAHKSCVVMCRRCVQAVLLDKDITDRKLDDMIDEARNKGVFTEEMYQTAKAVRFFANSGAHPQDPILRKVTPLQATLALQVTKEILQGIYPRKPEEPEQLEEPT